MLLLLEDPADEYLLFCCVLLIESFLLLEASMKVFLLIVIRGFDSISRKLSEKDSSLKLLEFDSLSKLLTSSVTISVAGTNFILSSLCVELKVSSFEASLLMLVQLLDDLEKDGCRFSSLVL